MGDLRRILDDAVSRRTPAADSVTRVTARAARRATHRRVAAGAIGLGLTAGLVGGFLYSVRGGPATPASNTTTSASNPPQAVEQARIICGEDGIQVLDLTVIAQPDGVHFSVRNDTQEIRDFSGWADVPAGGVIETVQPVPPGAVRISCESYSAGPGSAQNSGQVQVLDDQDHWVSPDLDCEGGVTGQSGLNPDYAEGAVGEIGAPAEALRMLVAGILDSDTVEHAGYVASDPPTMRVVRDNRVILTASLRQTAAGGWVLGSVRWCTSFRVQFP